MRKLFRITIILLISVLIISLFRLYRKYYAYPRIVDVITCSLLRSGRIREQTHQYKPADPPGSSRTMLIIATYPQ